jgi:hypothetical protein
MSKEFPIFDTKIVRSDGQENYNKFRGIFLDLADSQASVFEEEFYNKFSDMDKVIDGVDRFAYALIIEGIDVAVKTLSENGIFAYDRDRFITEYAPKIVEEWTKVSDDISDKYSDIVMTLEEREQYRAQRKANRSRVVGGGFSVGGYVKAQATAGVMNAGTGLFHGIANSVGNAMDRSEANRKKAVLYRNCVDILSQGIESSVYAILFPMLELLESNIKIEYVYQKDSDESSAIFSNIKSGNIPEGAIKEQLVNIISKDPYDEEIYEYICDRYGDADGYIGDLAEHFGCSVYDYKLNLVEEIFKGADFFDETKLKELYKKIEDTCSYYHIDDSNYRKMMDNILDLYQVNKRTVDGCIYDSVEDANNIKNTLESIINRIEGLSGNNKQEINDCLKALENSSCKSSKKYVDYLKEALHNADNRLCIVKGVKYESTDTAEKIRNEYIKLDNLVRNTTFDSLDVIDKCIAEIDLCSSEIREDYIKYMTLVKEIFERQTYICKNNSVGDLSKNKDKAIAVYTKAMSLKDAAKNITINALIDPSSKQKASIYNPDFNEWYSSLSKYYYKATENNSAILSKYSIYKDGDWLTVPFKDIKGILTASPHPVDNVLSMADLYVDTEPVDEDEINEIVDEALEIVEIQVEGEDNNKYNTINVSKKAKDTQRLDGKTKPDPKPSAEDMYNLKINAVEDKICTIDFSDENSIKIGIEKISEICKYFDLNSESYLNAFNNILDLYDKNRRTFDGKVYDSVDDAAAARNFLTTIINEVEGLSGNNLSAIEKYIISLNESICATKNKYIEYLNAAKTRGEAHLKMVKGLKYDNLEVSAKVREEAVELDKIVGNIPFISIETIDSALSDIAGFRTNIKEYYENYITVIKNIFVEMQNVFEENITKDFADFNNRQSLLEAYVTARELMLVASKLSINNSITTSPVIEFDVFNEWYKRLEEYCLTVSSTRYKVLDKAIDSFNKKIDGALKYEAYVKERAGRSGLFASLKNKVGDISNTFNKDAYEYITANGKYSVPNSIKFIDNNKIVEDVNKLIVSLGDIIKVLSLPAEAENEKISMKSLFVETQPVDEDKLIECLNKSLVNQKICKKNNDNGSSIKGILGGNPKGTKPLATTQNVDLQSDTDKKKANESNNDSSKKNKYTVILTNTGSNIDATTKVLRSYAEISMEEAVGKVKDLPCTVISLPQKDLAEIVVMEFAMNGAVAIIKKV